MPSELQPASTSPASPPPTSRPVRWHRKKIFSGAAFLLFVALAVAAFFFYLASSRFAARIQRTVVAVLQHATGGRVEIQHLQWSLLHLHVQIDGLTIHGLESPDQLPYFHADSIQLDAKVLSFFRPSIALSRLALVHPVFHLIVHADGTTNQPHPKTSSHSSFSSQTLFDLAVDRAEVDRGLIVINNRAVPWNLAAGNLNLLVRYVPTSQHYQAALAVHNFTFRLQNATPSHSALFLDADLSPQAANITRLEWNTPTTKLLIHGSLTHYAHLVWSGEIDGQADLHEVGAITGYDPLRHGIADLHLHATGSADGKFSIVGHITAQQGAFVAPWLILHNVAVDTHVEVDNHKMLFSQFTSNIHGEGIITGKMLLTGWLDAKPNTLQALIDAQVAHLSTPMVLAATATRNYADIGFTADASGPVRATWHGAGVALDVHGDLTFQPQLASQRRPGPIAIPVHGFVRADYLGDHERLNFQQVDLFTPGTEVHATGLMTLLPNDLQSQMHGTVTSNNVQDFDRLLYVVNYTFPNSSAAVLRGPNFALQSIQPVHLTGSAHFQGSFTGSLMDPVITGHVDSGSFYLQKNGFGPHPIASVPISIAKLPWDSLHGDLIYTSPQIDVRNAVLTHGRTVLHAQVQIRPALLSKDLYVFNTHTGLVADAHIDNASIADLQAFLGPNFGSAYSATGTLSANAQVEGTVDHLAGVGTVALSNASLAGQPIATAATVLSFVGHRIQARDIVARTASGALTGDFFYDYLSGEMSGSLTGSHLDLAQIPSLQSPRAAVDGLGSLQLQIAGTSKVPVVTGSAVIDNITLNHQAMGNFHVNAKLQGQNIALTAQAQLLQTHLDIGGNLQLTPGLPAQLQMNFADFDIHPVLQLYARSDLSGSSAIRGQVQLNGPLLDPHHLQVEANFEKFSATLNGILLSTYHPVRASLQNGLFRLYPVHIRGVDTDLKLQGTVELNQPHTLRAHAEGGINAALIKTFDDQLTASGHLDFIVDARGTWFHPRLLGTVQVKAMNVNVRDLTNGLTDLNGDLTFNQNRLAIEQLTGYTGGGKLEFSGFANFGDGLFVDFAANAKSIRIRYPQGVTSTANVNLHLNGAPDSLLLRGNIQLTRFAVSQNVDLAALAAASQSIGTPPDPTSLLNRVHLDVQVASASQLGFMNSFASLAGDVSLHVRGTLANPSLLGRVDITQGKATFAGTQYVLQRGDIAFTNPVTIEPEVDLEATARVRDYDIIIGLTGPANKLQVNYRSEPPLSQSDVLALLTLGRTNEEATMYGEQQQANGNPNSEALLGGALNAAVSNRVQQLFGVASVRVDPNFVGVLGQSTARVTVEQQVGPNVTLVFATNVNTTAQQLLQARYDITRNLSIIAVRDEADVFSLYFQIRGKHR